MKNILKVAIPISLVAILTLILCSIFIKPKVFNFKSLGTFINLAYTFVLFEWSCGYYFSIKNGLILKYIFK